MNEGETDAKVPWSPWFVKTHFSNVIDMLATMHSAHRHRARSFSRRSNLSFIFPRHAAFHTFHTAPFFLHIFQTMRKLTQVVSDIKMKN